MKKKFIFVTGGVLSSLGKGVSAAAIGALLKARGIRVTNVKMDPYINVDPGTMSPYQHGEVFVTEDGYEADLDLGHYERFTQNPSHSRNAFTAGRIYRNVIERERRGEYLGRTVQVIPHITDEIKRNIWAAAEEVDVAIVEVGGTVGDIEGLPFLEAIRQFRIDAGPENVLFVHVTLVPYIRAAGELKSKPTQHSVKELLGVGIQADILLCRAEKVIPRDMRQKIALFCNVDVDSVISAPDLRNIYELPLRFHDEGLDDRILSKMGMWAAQPHLEDWSDLVARMARPAHRVRIGIVGKYVHLVDTYKSLNEALVHGGLAHSAQVELVYVDSEEIDPLNPGARLADLDGVLVPGGFGDRGVEGKIAAVRWAREQKVPFFGICLGMQVAVIEFARNVLGLADANSREFAADSEHRVIELMDSQLQVTDKGGTMRLGAWPAVLGTGTLAQRIYGATRIQERHRHRYEVNPEYIPALRQGGLVLSGLGGEGRLVELVELTDHPHFIACQFHPEFKSRPLQPHPLFTAFVRAALAFQKSRGLTRGVSPGEPSEARTQAEAEPPEAEGLALGVLGAEA